MKVTNCAKIILLTLLIGCSETDKPSKYVFDAKKYEKNIDNYVISKGEMDKFTCGMMSMVFTKEVMQAIKENKHDPSEAYMQSLLELEVSKLPLIIRTKKVKLSKQATQDALSDTNINF